MERENILRNNGYKIETIWECEWTQIKETLNNKKDIEDHAKNQNINIREALFGGRTEAFKSYFKCNENQQILYYDVCSLYPTVNALDDYAIGYKRYVTITADDIASGEFFGVAKVDVIPPKDLYIPVLPDNSEGKLLFHLKPMYSKTWTSIELKKALEMGYRITKIHSALQYTRHTGLMKHYVEKFIKLKIKCSGTLSQDKCDDINRIHEKLGLTIDLQAEETGDNPGLRQVAKILLNSLWGKFGQRANMKSYEFINKYNDFCRLMADNTKLPMGWEVINKDIIEFSYTDDIDNKLEASYISEITAVFTTANARLRLYDMLSFLDKSQVMYCDTYSAIFMYDKTNPLHKYPSNDQQLPKSITFANKKEASLGEWESEFKKGEYIVELICGGAKTYAYQTNTGKTSIKLKGITLDVANSKIATFDALKEMVLNHKPITTAKRFQFQWDNKTKDVITKYISRSIKSTVSEKRTIDGYDTLPYGFLK
jgi:hypothetical protein